MTARAVLADLGIKLSNYAEGTRRSTCPRCSHRRSLAHRETQCLSVTIRDDGVVFYCWHCWWKGGSSTIAQPTNEAQLKEMEARRRERDIADRKVRTASALTFWRQGQRIVGTLGEWYLRHRGITIPLPVSLRFCPALKHPPTGLLLPAIIAAVQGPDRKITGIHRTYLRLDGTGKAPVPEPRLSLGVLTGSAVRLSAARLDAPLVVSEGIETGLSASQATGFPTWAALSTSGLKSLVLPPDIPDLVIAADNDESGAGQTAAKAAAERWASEGRRVRIALPPEPGTDFNDMIRSGNVDVRAA